MTNLLVLARESDAGADRVWADGTIVPKLLKIVRDFKNVDDDTAVTAIRVLDELAKDHKKVGLKTVCIWLSESDHDITPESTVKLTARLEFFKMN